jgi:hypothetical protein
MFAALLFVSMPGSSGSSGSGDFGGGYGVPGTFPADEGFLVVSVEGAGEKRLHFDPGGQDHWPAASAFAEQYDLQQPGCDRACVTTALVQAMRAKLTPLSAPVSMYAGAGGGGATSSSEGWARGFAAIGALLDRLNGQEEHWAGSPRRSCPRSRAEAETRSSFFFFPRLALDVARMLQELVLEKGVVAATAAASGSGGGSGGGSDGGSGGGGGGGGGGGKRRAGAAPNHVTVCETGFGVGHSAAVFLGASEAVRVVSFDLFDSAAKREALRALQSLHPGRLRPVAGSLPASLRQFATAGSAIADQSVQCDVIFVDVHLDHGEQDEAQFRLLASLAPATGAVLFHDELLPHFGHSWRIMKRTQLLRGGSEQCGRDARIQVHTQERGCSVENPCNRATIVKYCRAALL